MIVVQGSSKGSQGQKDASSTVTGAGGVFSCPAFGRTECTAGPRRRHQSRLRPPAKHSCPVGRIRISSMLIRGAASQGEAVAQSCSRGPGSGHGSLAASAYQWRIAGVSSTASTSYCGYRGTIIAATDRLPLALFRVSAGRCRSGQADFPKNGRNPPAAPAF
jgi:hypothetical protein